MNLIKILILIANPSIPNFNSLQVYKEAGRIEEAIKRSKYRDRFQVVIKPAVGRTELRRALTEEQSQIVHFAGHGAGEHGLVLENDAGKMEFVSTDALERMFNIFETEEIECVLLNACYSEVQAIAIHQSVDCVIGMNQPIGDQAAVLFAEGFYDALGDGKPYNQAFEIGCSAIDLAGSAEYLKPVLKYRRRRGAEVSRAPLQPEPGATEIAGPPVRHSQTQNVGKIIINGSHNFSNVVQAGDNINLNQTTDQSNGGNADVEAALALLAQLKRDVAATAELSAYAKEDAESKISRLEAKLQEPEPDKSFVNEAVQALQQGLRGVLTLAELVTKVADLFAKTWVGLP